MAEIELTEANARIVIPLPTHRLRLTVNGDVVVPGYVHYILPRFVANGALRPQAAEYLFDADRIEVFVLPNDAQDIARLLVAMVGSPGLSMRLPL